MRKIIKFLLLFIFSLVFVGCNNKNTIDDKVIVVGASVSPHAEILEVAREYIEEAGYELKIITYTDYIQPNVGVTDGSLDANFFQHITYLENYNKENKTNLVDVHTVHFEPLALYAGRKDSIDLSKGSSIGIPNDKTNGARALFLLQDLGLLELDQSKGFEVTKLDIISNPLDLKIVELEAAIIPSKLLDLDVAVINGNVALQANILDKRIADTSESQASSAAELFANIICVQNGHQEKDAIKVLIASLQQKKVINFIKENYQNIVIPIE